MKMYLADDPKIEIQSKHLRYLKEYDAKEMVAAPRRGGYSSWQAHSTYEIPGALCDARELQTIGRVQR